MDGWVSAHVHVLWVYIHMHAYVHMFICSYVELRKENNVCVEGKVAT